MPALSRHLSFLREALLGLGVRAWLRRPGRVLAAFVACLLVGGFASLFGAIHVAMTYGYLGSLAAAAWMIGSIAVFAVCVEPWLAPTGFRFRPLHASKAHPAGAQVYLLMLDRHVRDAGVVSRVKIQEGQCPWLLAYGIERHLAPARRAEHAAHRLDLAVPKVASTSDVPRTRRL